MTLGKFTILRWRPESGFGFLELGEDVFIHVSAIQGMLQPLGHEIDLSGAVVTDVSIGQSERGPKVISCKLVADQHVWTMHPGRCMVICTDIAIAFAVGCQTYVLDGTKMGGYWNTPKPLNEKQVQAVLRLGCPVGLIKQVRERINARRTFTA